MRAALAVRDAGGGVLLGEGYDACDGGRVGTYQNNDGRRHGSDKASNPGRLTEAVEDGRAGEAQAGKQASSRSRKSCTGALCASPRGSGRGEERWLCDRDVVK
jgi:hypothetical protein